jgi:Phage integrase family
MPRPSLPVGSHGKITTRQDGAVFVARTKFRDADGVVRPVKRTGKSRAAAERALKAALAVRQTPIAGGQLSPETRLTKVAALWLLKVEIAVDQGWCSPGSLSTYRSIYRAQVEPRLGQLKLREVSTPVVDKALAEIKAHSTSAARTAKIILSGIMRYAARHGAVLVNPVRELGGWREPSNVLKVWRSIRDDAEIEGLVTHTLRKTVASFLDDAQVSTRRISDQLGHAKVSMTQDRYLGHRLTGCLTADVLETMFERDPR